MTPLLRRLFIYILAEGLSTSIHPLIIPRLSWKRRSTDTSAMSNSIDITKSDQGSTSTEFTHDIEKQALDKSEQQLDTIEESSIIAIQDGYRLKHNLQARHLSMIAIGGSLGTGLLIGSGAALSASGPAPLFIGYGFVGAIVYMVMCCMGELATYIPLADGFSGYADRYADPALGFAVGYCYLFKYFIVTPNQITAGAMVMQYWVSREKVNPGVWITILLALIILINIFGVRIFGEFEFWLSCLKVLIVLGLILLLFVIMLGGAPTHDRLGFRYWQEPGAFKPYTGIADVDKGKFVSFVSVLVTAVFAYSGTELLGITVGEAHNPRRNVPRAIKLTFYRIVVFYVVSVFLLGMCVPYNDPLLINATKASTSASASPFVVAIKNAKIKGLDHVINACILIFIFSAANSDLYIGSRTLYGLACSGKAPKFFAKTSKAGIPYYALALCAAFCCLAYMSCAESSASVFGYFVNVVSIFGLLTWITILITHICFLRALKAQGFDRKTLAYNAPLQPYGTYIALGFCVLILFIKNFTVFINGFDWKNFITGYIGLPVYVIAYVGFKITTKCKMRVPAEVDLVTLKEFVDEEEQRGKEEDLAKKERLSQGKTWEWWYEKTFGMVF